MQNLRSAEHLLPSASQRLQVFLMSGCAASLAGPERAAARGHPPLLSCWASAPSSLLVSSRSRCWAWKVSASASSPRERSAASFSCLRQRGENVPLPLCVRPADIYSAVNANGAFSVWIWGRENIHYRVTVSFCVPSQTENCTLDLFSPQTWKILLLKMYKLTK